MGKDTPATAPTPDQRLVRARVMCPQYGTHVQGEVVEVTHREIERCVSIRDGKRVYDIIMPVHLEEKLREEERAPAQLAIEAKADRERSEAWKRLSQQSQDAMRRQQIEDRRRVLEQLAPTGGSGSAAPAIPAGPARP